MVTYYATDVLGQDIDWVSLSHLLEFDRHVDSEEFLKMEETTTDTDWVRGKMY